METLRLTPEEIRVALRCVLLGETPLRWTRHGAIHILEYQSALHIDALQAFCQSILSKFLRLSGFNEG
jgi:hypothetical protein